MWLGRPGGPRDCARRGVRAPRSKTGAHTRAFASTWHGGAKSTSETCAGRGSGSATSRAAAVPTVSTRSPVRHPSPRIGGGWPVELDYGVRFRDRAQGPMPEPADLKADAIFLVGAVLTGGAEVRVEPIMRSQRREARAFEPVPPERHRGDGGS